MSFLIYGASGYTGQLIVEKAVKKGLQPVLAGRNEDKIKPIAQKYGLDHLVFGLDNVEVVAAHLEKFPLVLNCAGPFSRTAKSMIQACLLSQTHYLDITGEIEVFELAKSFDAKAKESGIIIMPGVGFDVVPTDCMAKYLKTKLPDAIHLELAFTSVGGNISHGTMSTMVESLGKPGAVRENGKIVAKPLGHKGKRINFGSREHFVMSIPWGDVSTAYHTTGIPNIEVYTGVPKNSFFLMKLQALFNPLLRTEFVRKRIQKYVDEKITGPGPEQLERGRSFVYGKAENARGESVEARLECAEGYLLTAEMSLLITQKILNEKFAPGYHTPAELLGYALILEMPGAKFIS